MYAPNTRAPSFIKETLLKLKVHIAPNTITMGDFNIPLSSMDQSGKQKLNRETVKLTKALDQLDLTALYRPFHPKAKEYTFFLSTSWYLLQNRPYNWSQDRPQQI